jgi:cytochrome P450 family 110
MNLPPGPTFALSSRLNYVRNPYELFAECRRKYGDPFTVTTSMKTVITGDPAAVKQIFTAPTKHFKALQSKAQSRILGDSFTALSGPPHRAQREIVTPGLRADGLHGLAPMMVDAAVARIESWRPGSDLDMIDEGVVIALEIIVRTIFSVEDPAGIAERRLAIRDFGDRLSDKTFLILSVLGFLSESLPPNARFRAAQARLRQLLFETIDQIRAAPDRRRGLLARIVGTRTADGASAMPDSVIVDNMVTMLIAGHETSALSIGWTLYWALSNPEIYRKLMEELDGVDVERNPDATQTLPYLGAFVREALRFWPPVPDVIRVIGETPLEVAGYCLTENMQVAACVFLTHFNPDIYKEPDLFRPERHLDRRYSSYEYYPFGGGERVCVGNTFAPMEIKIVLAVLLKRCRFTLLNTKPPGVARTRFLMGPKQPIMCRYEGAL